MNDAAEKARDFREGYAEGAAAVVKAIGDGLQEQQILVLRKWIDGSLKAWRHDSSDAPPPVLPMIDGA